MPTRAEKYRARDLAVTTGGTAANAAVAIARLGGTVALLRRARRRPDRRRDRRGARAGGGGLLRPAADRRQALAALRDPRRPRRRADASSPMPIRSFPDPTEWLPAAAAGRHRRRSRRHALAGRARRTCSASPAAAGVPAVLDGDRAPRERAGGSASSRPMWPSAPRRLRDLTGADDPRAALEAVAPTRQLARGHERRRGRVLPGRRRRRARPRLPGRRRRHARRRRHLARRLRARSRRRTGASARRSASRPPPRRSNAPASAAATARRAGRRSTPSWPSAAPPEPATTAGLAKPSRLRHAVRRPDARPEGRAIRDDDPLPAPWPDRRAVRISSRARRCSITCAFESGASAPRRAAPRAIAAPARSCSGGARDGRLVLRAGQRLHPARSARLDGAEVITVEDLGGRGRRAPPGPGRDGRASRLAMRLLHARHRHEPVRALPRRRSGR